MARETGLSVDKIKELNFKHTNRYMTPQECVDWKIADRLLYELPQQFAIGQTHTKRNKRKSRKTKRTK